MHEVLVNRLGGLSLPRKSVVRLTDRPDMTLDDYRGRKRTQRLLTNDKLGLNWSFVALLFYVHGKHLGSCRDGQLTLPRFSWAALDLISG